jgi:hypothetical protein
MSVSDIHHSIERDCKSQYTRITAALNSVALSMRNLLTNRQNQYSEDNNKYLYDCMGSHHPTYGSIPIELTNASQLTEAQPIYEARKPKRGATDKKYMFLVVAVEIKHGYISLGGRWLGTGFKSKKNRFAVTDFQNTVTLLSHLSTNPEWINSLPSAALPLCSKKIGGFGLSSAGVALGGLSSAGEVEAFNILVLRAILLTHMQTYTIADQHNLPPSEAIIANTRMCHPRHPTVPAGAGVNPYRYLEEELQNIADGRYEHNDAVDNIGVFVHIMDCCNFGYLELKASVIDIGPYQFRIVIPTGDQTLLTLLHTLTNREQAATFYIIKEDPPVSLTIEMFGPPNQDNIVSPRGRGRVCTPDGCKVFNSVDHLMTILTPVDAATNTPGGGIPNCNIQVIAEVHSHNDEPSDDPVVCTIAKLMNVPANGLMPATYTPATEAQLQDYLTLTRGLIPTTPVVRLEPPEPDAETLLNQPTAAVTLQQYVISQLPPQSENCFTGMVSELSNEEWETAALWFINNMNPHAFVPQLFFEHGLISSTKAMTAEFLADNPEFDGTFMEHDIVRLGYRYMCQVHFPMQSHSSLTEEPTTTDHPMPVEPGHEIINGTTVQTIASFQPGAGLMMQHAQRIVLSYTSAVSWAHLCTMPSAYNASIFNGYARMIGLQVAQDTDLDKLQKHIQAISTVAKSVAHQDKLSKGEIKQRDLKTTHYIRAVGEYLARHLWIHTDYGQPPAETPMPAQPPPAAAPQHRFAKFLGCPHPDMHQLGLSGHITCIDRSDPADLEDMAEATNLTVEQAKGIITRWVADILDHHSGRTTLISSTKDKFFHMDRYHSNATNSFMAECVEHGLIPDSSQHKDIMSAWAFQQAASIVVDFNLHLLVITDHLVRVIVPSLPRSPDYEPGEAKPGGNKYDAAVYAAILTSLGSPQPDDVGIIITQLLSRVQASGSSNTTINFLPTIISDPDIVSKVAAEMDRTEPDVRQLRMIKRSSLEHKEKAVLNRIRIYLDHAKAYLDNHKKANQQASAGTNPDVQLASITRPKRNKSKTTFSLAKLNNTLSGLQTSAADADAIRDFVKHDLEVSATELQEWFRADGDEESFALQYMCDLIDKLSPDNKDALTHAVYMYTLKALSAEPTSSTTTTSTGTGIGKRKLHEIDSDATQSATAPDTANVSRPPPADPAQHTIHEIRVPLESGDLLAMRYSPKMREYWIANKMHGAMANSMTSPLDMAISLSMQDLFDEDFKEDMKNFSAATRALMAQQSLNDAIPFIVANNLKAASTGASPGNKSSKKPKLSPLTGSSTADKHYLDQEEDDAESFECVCEDGPDKSAPNYCSCCNGLYSM